MKQFSNLEQEARLRWSCRRGMLELDILLLSFLEKAYSKLSEDEQVLFARLLESADQDLFRWLVVGEMPANAELITIVERIRTHVETST